MNSFWQRDSTSLHGLENQKTLESFWQNEEEKEVQRDSRLVKDCIELVVKCKTKPCFYRLFMSGQEGHSKEL